MKAVLYTEYGSPDVLKVAELPKPEPKENELLIKIHATHLNYGDLLARNFKATPLSEFNMPFLLWVIARLAFGFNKPKNPILGSEFSGVIESVGKNVSKFKSGDEVFGYLGQNMGANVEYLCSPENGVVAQKPSNVTMEEAATLPYGGMTAMNLLKNVQIENGDKVLINGASGGIGSYLVQFAKQYGAEVTGVCGTNRVEYVKSLGADKVIDYTKENFGHNGETYDLIVDVLGRLSFSRIKNSLKKNGRILYVSFKSKHLVQMLRTKLFGSKKVICTIAPESVESINKIKELVEAGKIKTSIDRSFPMTEAAEAHRYAQEGNRRGNVVITFRAG